MKQEREGETAGRQAVSVARMKVFVFRPHFTNFIYFNLRCIIIN